jgi:hypothetical protein
VIGTPVLVKTTPPTILLFGNLSIRQGRNLIEIFNPVVDGYHNEINRMEGATHDVSDTRTR